MAKGTFPIGLVGRYKHGMILESMRSRGWTQKRAAEFLGMRQTDFGRLINLQEVPKKLTFEQEKKFMELTGRSIGELWPDEVFTEQFLESPKIVEIVREVPIHVLAGSGMLKALPMMPDQAIAQQELARDVEEILKDLSPREAEIVQRVVMEGEAGADVAASLRLSRSRLDQILKKALRRLRHPIRSQKLRGHNPYLTGS